MRFLPTVGLYWKPAGTGSLDSGVYYSTQPTDIPSNALAFENNKVFEFVRISGTATAGSLCYYTGVNQNYVCFSGTGVKPAGILLHSPTASGTWAWIQKYGANTSLQCTSTFGINQLSASAWAAMYAGGGSALVNKDVAISSIQTGAISGPLIYVGYAMSNIAGSAGLGFINVL